MIPVIEVDMTHLVIPEYEELEYGGVKTIGGFLPQAGITKEAIQWCEENHRVLISILPVHVPGFGMTMEDVHRLHPNWPDVLKVLDLEFDFEGGSIWVYLLSMPFSYYETPVSRERLLDTAKVWASYLQAKYDNEPWNPIAFPSH